MKLFVKKKLLGTFLLLFCLPSLAFSSPKYVVSSGGSNAGGSSIETDEFTGAATYSITLPVPPAPGSVQPVLNLNYNSYRKNPNSWVGYGWELDLGMIQRIAGSDGSVDYINGQSFEARFSGQTETLILDQQNISPASYGISSLIPSGATIDKYQAKIESAFNLYFHIRIPNGNGTYQDDGWIVIDKGGMQYHFGRSNYSKEETLRCLIAEESDPSCLQYEWVSKWMLNQAIDANGNSLYVSYIFGPTPFSISYPGVSIDFDVSQWEENVSFPTFRQGFLFKDAIGMRLNSITISGMPGGRLQKYVLGYAPHGADNLNQTNKLISITQYGQTDSESLPPTTFDYYNMTLANVNFEGPFERQASHNVGGYNQDGRLNYYTSFADMNGDGLVDHVVSYPRNITSTIFVYYNNGNTFEYIPGKSEWTDPFSFTDCSAIMWDCSGNLNTYIKAGNEVRQWVYLIDMNGDNLPDRVKSDMDQNGNNAANFLVALNNGNGWNTNYQVWSDPSADPNFSGISNLNQWLMDMNGDGLPDRVVGNHNEGIFNVYYNNGAAFSLTPTVWKDPLAGEDPNHSARGKLLGADGTGTYVFIRDMNGDGLPDRVWRKSVNIIDAAGNIIDPDRWMFVIALNRGGNEFAPIEPNQSLDDYVDGVNIIGILDPIQEDDCEGYITERCDFIDFNGDGFLDRVVGNNDEASSDYGKIKVYFYNGMEEELRWSELSPPLELEDPIQDGEGLWDARGLLNKGNTDNGTGDPRLHVLTIDLTGDGYPDRVEVSPRSGDQNTNRVFKIYPLRFNKLRFSNYPAHMADVWVNQPNSTLKSINDGQGNETIIEYSPSNIPINYPDPHNRFLPFSLYLAHKIYTRDYTMPLYSSSSGPWEGRRNIGFRWATYNYYGGNLYVRQAQRVAPTDPNNISLSQTYFSQFNGFQEVIKEIHQAPGESWPPFSTTSIYNQAEGDINPHDATTYNTLFAGVGNYNHFAFSGRPYKTIIEEDGADRVVETKTWQINALPGEMFSCDGACFPKLFSNQKTVLEAGSTTARISSVEFQYDEIGNVTHETYKDRGGNTLLTTQTFYYDSNNFSDVLNLRSRPAWQKKSKDGQVYRYKSFVYDAQGNPIEERFHLDDSGSNYHSISRTFFSDGNLHTITDLDGVTKTISYDVADLFPVQESVTYPSGNSLTTTREFEHMAGQITSETFSTGVGTITEYDDFGRPTLEKTVNTTGTPYEVKGYEYNYVTTNLGNQSDVILLETKIYQPQPGYPETNINGPKPALISYTDAAGTLLQQCSLSERGDYRRIQSRNENGGRQSLQIEPVFSNDCTFLPTLASSVRTTLTTKDLQGRPLTVTPPSGDADSPVGNVTYGYATNASGQYVVTTTHSSGQNKTETFDYNERLVSLVKHDGTEVSYVYNPVDDLAIVRVNGQLITEIDYDLLGRKETMTDADMGTWQYFYDANMRLYKQIDNKGQYFLNTFDSVGRILRKDVYNSVSALEKYETYTYDTGDSEHNVIESELFRVQEFMPDGTLIRQTRFGYGSDFRDVAKVTRTIPGLGDFVQTSEKDHLGQLLSTTYPSGDSLYLQYNTIGGMEKICNQSDCNSETGEIYYTIDSTNGYNVFGNVLKETYGNGVQSDFTYYPNSHRLSEAKISKTDQIYSQRSYKFDDRSNITTLADLLQPTGPQSTTLSSITYDLNDRLQSYTAPSSASTVTFNHDTKGNLIQNSLSFGTDTYQYTSNRPHAVTQIGSQTFAYDDNGNMTSDAHRQMTYNAQNQLTKATMTNGTVIDYDYDYAGGRTKKTVTRQDPLGRVITTHTHYLGDALEIRGEKILLHIHAGSKKIATKVVGTVSEIIAAASSSSLTKINFHPEFRFGLALPYLLLFFTLFLIFSFRPVNTQPVWLLRFTLKARAPPKFLWLIAPLYIYKIFRSYRKVFQETLFALPQRTAFKLTSFALTLLFLLQFPLHTAFATNHDAAIPQSDENYFYYVHGDHLGSTHVLTEGKKEGSKHSGIFYKQGTLLQRMEYAPFGKETFVLNPNLQFEPGYTGQTYDVESGLYYYKSRYYNPELARFIQPDTVVPDAKNLEAYNRYSYVINNPLKYIDPTGHSFWTKLIGVFIGAFIAALITVLTLGAMGVTGATLGAMIANASFGQLVAAGAIGGLIGGAIGGAISGGLRGALMGALFGALGGAISGAMGFGIASIKDIGLQRAVSAMLIGAGAAVSNATGGWKGLLLFGAGLAGAYLGSKVGTSAANKFVQSSGVLKSEYSNEEFGNAINKIKSAKIDDPKLSQMRNKVVDKLEILNAKGKIVNGPLGGYSGEYNPLTGKITIDPSFNDTTELPFTLAHEGLHAVSPFMSHLKVYQFEWDIANTMGVNLYGGRPTKDWLKIHLAD